MPNNPREEGQARKKAEEALLGSILISCSDGSPEVIEEVKRTVAASDFEDSRHVRIYTAMINCPHPDQISVAYELQRQGLLSSGDCAYLCHLVAICPTSLDYEYYAKIVAKPLKIKKGGINIVS